LFVLIGWFFKEHDETLGVVGADLVVKRWGAWHRGVVAAAFTILASLAF
jgi:hypothetical protein